MGLMAYSDAFCHPPLWSERGMFIRTVVSSERRRPGGVDVPMRRRVLKKVDKELLKGNKKTALKLVKQLQGKPGGLHGFGGAKQVPPRCYTLDELNLTGVDTSSLQLLVKEVLDSIEKSASLKEEMESSMLETTDQFPFEDYRNICVQHESGHFLIAYLLGILPEGYLIPSVEAMKESNVVEGAVNFVGYESLSSVKTRGKVSSKDLNRYSCIALAGLAAEHLAFGCSEGSFHDVEKLNTYFNWWGLTESEAHSQIEWSVLNTVIILNRHNEARSKLAKAMSLGRSVGFCIDTIENVLKENEI